jgi:hypothetical protein
VPTLRISYSQFHFRRSSKQLILGLSGPSCGGSCRPHSPSDTPRALGARIATSGWSLASSGSFVVRARRPARLRAAEILPPPPSPLHPPTPLNLHHRSALVPRRGAPVVRACACASRPLRLAALATAGSRVGFCRRGNECYPRQPDIPTDTPKCPHPNYRTTHRPTRRNCGDARRWPPPIAAWLRWPARKSGK